MQYNRVENINFAIYNSQDLLIKDLILWGSFALSRSYVVLG